MIAAKKEQGQASEDYPKFNSFMYSLDVFVPLINLHQAEYWLPNANRAQELRKLRWLRWRTGGLLCVYLWIHTFAGWILTTLLILALTGLVRT